MGCTCCSPKVDSLFVDDEEEKIIGSLGFGKSMFKKKEWTTLKTFSNKRNIRQHNLNIVFKKFLSHPEVADVFVPFIYLRPFPGLEEPTSSEEVTFARFVIMSYLFCGSPMVDLAHLFFSLLRQKMALKLNAVIFTFNFQEIANVITEDLRQSAAVSAIKRFCNPKNDREVSIKELCQMAIKYPILFYGLFKFRYHFRRLVFGDKFWENRKNVKSQLDVGIPEKSAHFKNEASAIKQSARAIIADVAIATESVFELAGVECKVPKKITKATFKLLKDIFGYQIAKGLILESEIFTEGDFALLTTTVFPVVKPLHEEDEAQPNVLIYDPKIKREFLFEESSGLSAWKKRWGSQKGGCRDLLTDLVFVSKRGFVHRETYRVFPTVQHEPELEEDDANEDVEDEEEAMIDAYERKRTEKWMVEHQTKLLEERTIRKQKKENMEREKVVHYMNAQQQELLQVRDQKKGMRRKAQSENQNESLVEGVSGVDGENTAGGGGGSGEIGEVGESTQQQGENKERNQILEVQNHAHHVSNQVESEGGGNGKDDYDGDDHDDAGEDDDDEEAVEDGENEEHDGLENDGNSKDVEADLMRIQDIYPLPQMDKLASKGGGADHFNPAMTKESSNVS